MGTQNDLLSRHSFAKKLADFIIRWRWLIILFTLLLAGVAGSGGRHLVFANDYRIFFGKENPELLAFENFQNTYTKNDNILFIIQPREGKVLTPELSSVIEEITERAWKLPYAIRVDSLTNFQHTWANGDDLTVEDLIADGIHLSQKELDEKEAIALAEPLLKNNLLSHDADTTGINVTLQYPEKSLKEVPEAAAASREIVEDIRKKHPDLTVALSGLSMMNNAFVEAGQKDMMTLIPIMYAILLLIMALSLRSIWATFATLLVIAFSSITAMGIAGFMGVQVTPISATAPTIILTLAIADSIHILTTTRKLLQSGFGEKLAAIKESLRINFIPVSITSLTTIIGFLALNFTDTPPFHDLGNITAVGIAAAWLYSITFLPALVSILPFRCRERAESAQLKTSLLDRYAQFATRNYRKILLFSGAAAVFLAVMVSRVELNDEWVKYFDHRIDFRNDAEFGMKHLNGLYLIEFSVGAGEEGGISNPEYLQHLEKFTTWLRNQPDVVHVYSYADIIKRLNKNMHGDDPTWYTIPEDRELAAQYLLLYELSLPYGLDLNDRISIDKSSTRVTATLPEISTVKVRQFLQLSKNWLKENAPNYMQTEPTGATVMFSYISERNINSMLQGNAMALLLIALVMMLTLRSFGIGLLSLIPNTLPILITFGLWGLLVGQVGMAAATVTATSLGIIVDDTVHFLAKYLLARREKGLNRAEAIHYAFNTVGSALLTTTVVLALGFAVLTYSTFRINSQMGLLTAIAIIVAFIFDFTILPALLLLGSRKKRSIKNKEYEKSYAPIPS